MADELSKLEQYRRDFISNISHDFRSPLTSIKGYVEAIKDGTIPVEKQDRYLDIILNETQRLTRLTTGLLDLNKLEEYGPYLKLKDFDLIEIIKPTLNTFEMKCIEKNIAIYLYNHVENTLVTADKTKIQQVIYNHIDTAIKDVEQSGRVEFERFLCGCLTIYGYLSIEEFANLWRGFYPDRKQEEIFRFMESYSPFSYLTDGMGKHIMYPDMDVIDLIAEQRGRGTYEGPLAKVSLEDILSAGKTTPYNFPYVSHKEGLALADALKAVGHGGDAGAIRMHWLWREIEMGGGDEQAFQDLVQRILKDVHVVSIEKTRALGRAIEDYCNAIPLWGTRGLSSIESMLGERIARGSDAMSAFVRERMSGLMKDGAFPKVGRNDPCPCGSGKKYKDCHGKNHN